jgi:hypothetical protein
VHSEPAQRGNSANSQKSKRTARNSNRSGVSADDEPVPPMKSDPHQLMHALKTKLAEGLGPAKFAQVRCAAYRDRWMALVGIGAPCARARRRRPGGSTRARVAGSPARSAPLPRSQEFAKLQLQIGRAQTPHGRTPTPTNAPRKFSTTGRG